jgi:hypothetical protein
MANSELLPYVLPYSDAVFCCESSFIAYFACPENTALDCSNFSEKLPGKDGNQRGTEPHFIDDSCDFRRANWAFGDGLE